MELTFLSGPVALTKTMTYNSREQTYHTSSYPLVQKVTSYSEPVTTIDAMHDAIVKHGMLGHALLKGNLSRQLVSESRAGVWRDEPHQWVVFDFDKISCPPTLEGVEQAVQTLLPDACKEVDYIAQLSSSCFRPDATKLSAHVFMLLSKGYTSKELADWITSINFQNDALKCQLSLTDSGMALHMPLDRSVCVPSKLIYISPPRCFGFTPAVSESTTIADGTQRTLTLPAYTPIAPSTINDTVNDLRKAAHMPPRTHHVEFVKDREVLMGAEMAVVHDVKPSGEGYIRFNMNGGDSLAYFINLREPQFIGNHKNEPWMMTEEVAPDLYKSLVKTSKHIPPKALQSCAVEPIAFYATNRGSQLYVGTFDREKDELRIDTASKDAAYSWLGSYGIPGKGAFPHYDLVFDMTSLLRFEEGYPTINLYRQTDLVKQFAAMSRTRPLNEALIDHLKGIAPVTYRVLDSVLGNDTIALTYFLNWLAAIFQRRTRVNTAWVLSGVEGTGKGFVTNYICRHLFGDTAVTQQLYEHVNDKFNEFLEGRLIVSLNEAAMSKSMDVSNVMSKLRDWITEPKIVIRGMHKAGREAENTSNFIVCSNSKSKPIQIEAHDRRFNFGEYQTTRLLVTSNELVTVTEGTEMSAFAQMLGELIVDDERLNTPFTGETKIRVYEATHNLLDRVARAIEEGDVDYFLDVRPSTLQLQTDFSGKMLPTREYDDLLRGMISGNLTVLKYEDLYVLFRMVAITDKVFPETKAQQRQIFQRYGLLNDKTYHDKRSGKPARGAKAPEWRVSGETRALYDELVEIKSDNVRAIK